MKSMSDEGTGSAVFATLQVIDKDADVIMPGSIADSPKTVKLVAAHDWKAPNIGMATIKEVGNELVADFKFYLDMPSAKEWYTALKNNFDNGVSQEFSFGFNTTQAEKGTWEEKSVRLIKGMSIFEVSPVMIGAGENTRTLAVKAAESEDETIEQKNERFADHADRVSDDVDALIARSKALAALRSKEGRTLSQATRTRLNSLKPRLTEALADLDSLLAESDAVPTQEMGAIPELGKSADQLYAEFLKVTTSLAGHLPA